MSKEIQLGIEVIQALIPQRRPFLMVDRLTFFSMTPQPSIHCVKNLSANESFFAGHYPSLAIMPGALTFEGMGQSANLLAAILTLRNRFERRQEAPDTVISHLVNIQHGYSLSPAFNPGMAQRFKELSSPKQGDQSEPEFGMVGAVNLKFLEPVFAGSTLHYQVILTGVFEAYMHFTVETVVADRTVARGTMATIRGLGVSNHLGWQMNT
ncbi:MAG: hypothetical protein JW795_03870 [Chitinivibrionales bacterium]|nr:hypothetical protein [Chitinivibrionales bacterium]